MNFYMQNNKGALMYKDTEYLEFLWPMRHYLLSCGRYDDAESEADIVAVSFCMPVSKQPPLIACAIGKDFYSNELIKTHKEFIVNVPEQKLTKEIYYCGFHSGRDVDKFKETGLTPLRAGQVQVPGIKECIAFMECRLVNVFDTGDKDLFIGEVVESYADERAIQDKKDIVFASGDFPQKIYGNRFKS